MQRYQEINNFFNIYTDIIITNYNENQKQIVNYELKFLENLFSHLGQLSLQNINYPISNVSNTINMSRNYNSLHFLKNDIYNIANYFQNDVVYDIYLEITKVLINTNYKISKEIINNKFNIENYKEKINGYSEIIC